MKTFHAWLLAQQHRDDPTGDLSRDLATDTENPTSDTELYAYFKRVCHFHGAEEFIDEVWLEYLAERAL